MSKYALRKRPEYILSEESAREQILDLLEYYDLDVENMPEDAKPMFERALDSISEYVRRGVVEMQTDKDNRLNVIQHLSGGDTLTYGELKAHHKLSMDRVKQGENYKRIYALMGGLCGLGNTAIEKLPARDLSIAEVLGTVFSNV